MGGLQNNLHRVPPTQKLPARAIGLGREVVAEVVLLVSGQQVARVDAKGIIALVADRLLLTKWHDRRDPIGKAVGRERLLLELDVGAGVVAKPKAPVAVTAGPLEDQREILCDGAFHMGGEDPVPPQILLIGDRGSYFVGPIASFCSITSLTNDTKLEKFLKSSESLRLTMNASKSFFRVSSKISVISPVDL